MLSNDARADLLLVLVTLVAAVSWMFSREAVLLMPPLLFMALRFTLAATVLAMFAGRQLTGLTGAQLRAGVLVGFTFGVAMSCWIMGLSFSDHVGVGAFLTSLGVVLVPVIARIGFGERPPASTWLALPVAVAGLALLALRDGFGIERGQLFFVIAATLFALYYTLNTRAANHSLPGAGGKVRERVPAAALTTVALAMVALVTGTLSLLLEPVVSTMRDFSTAMAGWILASALLGTALRFFLQTWAQSLSVTSHGVVIMIVEPVWTALMAAGWFGERMTPRQLAGCTLIFCALLVSRWRGIRQMLRRRH